MNFGVSWELSRLQRDEKRSMSDETTGDVLDHGLPFRLMRGDSVLIVGKWKDPEVEDKVLEVAKFVSPPSSFLSSPPSSPTHLTTWQLVVEDDGHQGDQGGREHRPFLRSLSRPLHLPLVLPLRSVLPSCLSSFPCLAFLLSSLSFICCSLSFPDGREILTRSRGGEGGDEVGGVYGRRWDVAVCQHPLPLLLSPHHLLRHGLPRLRSSPSCPSPIPLPCD